MKFMMLGALALMFCVALSAAAPNQGPGEVSTVERVDLDRYTGQWFEVARFPNRFQRQCAGDVRATYIQRPDGRIDVVNECRKEDGSTETARGIARVVDERTQAKLKVRFAPSFLSFLPFVWGDYWVIGLADDYSWATVGSPDREYLWILSRTPQLDAEARAQAEARAAANGFDTGRLVPTEQAGSGEGSR
jgi:apolipoprotein D and lipocalin family protein